MPEPVTNAEIEDVLSSIRRLVSENASVVRNTEAAAHTPDKLVLTPALRIDEPEAAEPEAGGEAPAEWSVAGSEDALQEPEAAEDWPAEPQGREPEPQPEDAPQTQELAAEMSLQDRIAELEAAIDRTEAEWEPDGSEADQGAEVLIFQHGGGAPQTHAEASPAASEAETWPEGEPHAELAPDAHEAAEAAAGDATTVEAEAAAPDATEPDAAELEAVPEAPYVDVSDDAPQDWEDLDLAQSPGAEAIAQTEWPGEGAPEADWHAEAERAPEMTAAAFAMTGPEDEAEVIDEDMLREMVARMVREELQGRVGERITQNVRRLVRREIARALSLQDFE